jgi:hypothetical protein
MWAPPRKAGAVPRRRLSAAHPHGVFRRGRSKELPVNSKPLGAFVQRIDCRPYRCAGRASPRDPCRSRSQEGTSPAYGRRPLCYLCRRTLANAEFTRRSNGIYFWPCRACNRQVFGQRRCARLAAAGGSYTLAEWDALLAGYHRCPACLRAKRPGDHPGHTSRSEVTWCHSEG